MKITKNAVLYYGSKSEIKSPLYAYGRKTREFGQGFYTTPIQSRAEGWATMEAEGKPIINEYNLNTERLKIYYLNSLKWIAEILANKGCAREYSMARDSFISKYRTDLSAYDIIVGYAADDSYFLLVEGFLQGIITATEVEELYNKNAIVQQICIKSEKGFSNIKFIKSYEIEGNISQVKNRDIEARKKVEDALNIYRKRFYSGNSPEKYSIFDCLEKSY